MTIDKIKYYMMPCIFDFWANCTDIAVMQRAKNILSEEISNGILTDVKYIAELNFLNMRLDQN